MSKPWYRSKTIWVQLLTLVVAVLATVVDSDLIAEHPKITSFILVVVAIINIVIRFLTEGKVTARTKSKRG